MTQGVAGGHKYKDADTGQEFPLPGVADPNFFTDLSHAGEVVANHRKGNNLPPIDTVSEIMNYTCEQMSDEDRKVFCKIKDEKSTQTAQKMKRGFMTRVSAAIALKDMTKRKMAGLPILVSREKANERAMVCLNCPSNITPDWSLQQQMENKIFSREVKRAKRDGQTDMLRERGVDACEICSCDNATTVHLVADIFRDGIGPILNRLPKFCWKKKELQKLLANNGT